MHRRIINHQKGSPGNKIYISSVVLKGLEKIAFNFKMMFCREETAELLFNCIARTAKIGLKG